MDAIDQQIVAQLVADARSSYTKIGGIVGLSAPAVKRRVDKLLDAGVLRGFTAVVDPGALRWGTEAFVEVHCQGNVAPSQIRDGLLLLPEVVAAYTVSGAADAIVHLRTGGIAHLEATLERLRAVDFVEHTVSTVVLSTLLKPGLTPREWHEVL
ncbi:MAG: Lrp/AsnC family transcriptional regulator [Pseudonocardiaceae bacterium]